MSIEKIIYTGVLSYIIMATNRILEIAFKINLYDTQNIGTTLLYLLSSILTFISFYALCNYTDRSSVAGKINLMAVFSIIPMLAFDCVNLLTFIIPEFDSLYTRSILFAASSCFSCVLFGIFIFGVHKHRVSSSISKTYKLLLISLGILMAVTAIDSSITISMGTMDIMAFCVFIFKALVSILMVLNYKYIVMELIKIADKNIDNNEDEEYLSF